MEITIDLPVALLVLAHKSIFHSFSCKFITDMAYIKTSIAKPCTHLHPAPSISTHLQPPPPSSFQLSPSSLQHPQCY